VLGTVVSFCLFLQELRYLRMSEVEAAAGAGDGEAAPQARQAGAWNRHDDAAVAGILAAARAAGATGASVRYGAVITKVWFEPQGSEPTLVKTKMDELQLATAQARLDELERAACGRYVAASAEGEGKKEAAEGR